MFIVKRKSELIRFGLFLLLVAGMVWFVVGRFPLWRVSDSSAGGDLSLVGPLVVAEQPKAADPAVSPVAGPGVVDPGEGRDFFAEYRIERERTRGALGDRLKEIMEAKNASPEAQKEASQQYLQLGQVAALESKAEAMVKARDYDDVIVHLAEGSAQVVVKAAELSHQQVAQIMDTVSRITGVKASAITVMAKYR